MAKANLTISPELEVTVLLNPTSGDLRVRGTVDDEVRAEGDRVTLQHDEGSGQVTATGHGDLKLYVPERAALRVQSVAGDARITGLDGEVQAENISGDLVMRDVGSAKLNNISADLRVRRVEGALEVDNVGSDATVREVDGDVLIRHVGADLFVGDVEGSCVVEHVGSDLVLSTPFYPDQTYRFSAGSGVVCRVPPESSVRFYLPPNAKVNVKTDTAAHTEEDGRQVVTFGDGEARVYIDAAGQVKIVQQTAPSEESSSFDFDIDFDFDFGFVDERLAENLATLEEKVAEQLSGLDERLSRSIARQAEKVQRQADRMRQQAEKRAERMRRAAERRAKESPRTWAFVAPEPPKPPAAPTPPAEPVSDEERLTILRMLENGKISVEEAERLLLALEGRTQ